MAEDPKKIDLLVDKLNLLMKKQENFQEEINRLSLEIYQLKNAGDDERLPKPSTYETEQSKEIKYDEPSVTIPQKEKNEWQEFPKKP